MKRKSFNDVASILLSLLPNLKRNVTRLSNIVVTKGFTKHVTILLGKQNRAL